jgi:hypothetical protein
MTPANRPITSREYNLLLNTERFRDRVAGANRPFRDVQNQAGWLAQFGSTKTAYVFELL